MNSDDGNLDVLKGNCKVLSLSEKVKVLDLIQKKYYTQMLLQSTT